MTDNAIKRRKPWLAALSSFVCTGLGQLYNGQWKKGLLFFCVELLLGYSLIATFGSFAGLMTSLIALFSFNILVAGEAFVSARPQKEYVLKAYNRKWVYILLLVLNLVSGTVMETVLEGVFFKSFKVPSGSMLTTLRIGDHFMTGIVDGDTPIERGDIVVFKFPEDPSKHYVKRIIGLPGETVRIERKRVSVNGVPLAEPYANHTKEDHVPVRDSFGPVTMDVDEYFVLGDNREASYDSRWWGPVGKEAFIAKALYIYFPGGVSAPDWADRIGAEIR